MDFISFDKSETNKNNTTNDTDKNTIKSNITTATFTTDQVGRGCTYSLFHHDAQQRQRIPTVFAFCSPNNINTPPSRTRRNV